MKKTSATKKVDKESILNEIDTLINKWQEQGKEPAILKRFMECCAQLSANSIVVADSKILFFRNWILDSGGSFEMVHRYLIKISVSGNQIEIRINYFDFEYFVFVNSKLEKIFKNIPDVRTWFKSRFDIV